MQSPPKRTRNWTALPLWPEIICTRWLLDCDRFIRDRWTPFQSLFARRLCLTFVATLLMFNGAACRRAQKAWGQSDAIQIDPAQPQRRTLSTGERHRYGIHLAAGQYLRLRLEQNGIDVSLEISDPGGRLAVAREGHSDGQAAISLVTERDGEYGLEIRAAELEQVTGSYELKAEELRLATVRDNGLIDGERAFAEGESLRARSEKVASQEAVKKFQEAEHHWQNAGQNQDVARALNAAGEIYQQLGVPHRALGNYENALSLLHASPSAEVESETLCDLSYVLIHLGNYHRALEESTQALKLSRDLCDPRREAQALFSLSEVWYGFGDRWKALQYAQWASSLSQVTRDRRKQAQALLSLGYIYTDLKGVQQATSYYDQALALYHALEDKRGRALAIAAKATLKVIAGEAQAALTLYQQARPVLEAAGDRYWEGCLLQNMGALYLHLGNPDKVLSQFEQARQIWKEIENPAEEAGVLSVIGWLHFNNQKYQQALSDFRESLSVSEALSDKKYQSNALRKIGAVYNELGNKKQAIIHFRKALALHRAGGEQQSEASALNELGNLYRSIHRIGQARTYLQQALAIDRARGDRFAESETLYHLSQVESDGGRLTEARSYIESALQLIESLRANVASQKLRVTYFASTQRCFEFLVALLMRQHQLQPAGGFADQALAVCERARARSLLELLAEAGANIYQGADPALLDQAKTLQAKISALVEKKVRLLDLEAPLVELNSISQEIDDLMTQRDRVEALIKSKSPRYASLIQPQPMSTREIQELLDENTLLLEFSLGVEHSYLWVVSDTGLKSYELPRKEIIEKAARETHALLAPPDSAPVQTDKLRTAEYYKTAAKLSQLILSKVAKELGRKRLVIVADGILQYIPFSVLPNPDADNFATINNGKGIGIANAVFVPLIYDHEIVNLPSATTLAVLRRETTDRKKAPKTIAVLADPVFQASDWRLASLNGQEHSMAINQSDMLAQLSSPGLKRGGILKRLRGTLKEAKAIEELTRPAERLVALGFDANLNLATSSQLSKYQIVHFATHGVLDAANPEYSALVFSLFDPTGKPRLGYLYLQDIYNLTLPAELVVLSACDTGLGKEFKGEGLVGLTRGFMYAGAPRVMASLWKVDDEPTAKLMRYFYEHLLKEKMSPAAALRAAQLSLSQDAEWNAPYHWGSFVLQGEWK